LETLVVGITKFCILQEATLQTGKPYLTVKALIAEAAVEVLPRAPKL
jgi:hypothetical protein